MTALLPLSVLLPLGGAALALVAGRRPRIQRVITIAVLSAQVCVELVMLIGVDGGTTLVMHLGGWAAPVGITLVADRLAVFLQVISTLVALAVGVYAIAAGHADGGEGGDRGQPPSPVSIFHPCLLILAAGVSNAFIAGDLFNLFVSFEILLTASYVLLTTGGTRERLRAGAPYVVVSLLSSMIFLSAIAMVYAATGTLNLADLAVKLRDVAPGTANLLHAMLLVAFGVKAAVWPMSYWLPDSYPTAPAPVTAVFAGLLTKVGIYAIIRTETLLFPGGHFRTLLLLAAVATMIIGIAGAMVQQGIKRLLSFTLVSHIGYMLFGIALGSAAGLSAAIFYVGHHILVQAALFLAAGLIERRTGTTVLSRLGGLSASGVLAALFFIPAMNLAGVPPLSGFLGKVGLFRAGLADGAPLAVAVVAAGALTGLLTLYAMIRVWSRAFWHPAPAADGVASGSTGGRNGRPGRAVREERPGGARRDELPGGGTPGRSADPGTSGGVAVGERRRGATRLPLGMIAATGGVVVAGLLLTVLARPIFALTDQAALDLLNPAIYIHAVLGSR